MSKYLTIITSIIATIIVLSACSDQKKSAVDNNISANIPAPAKQKAISQDEQMFKMGEEVAESITQGVLNEDKSLTDVKYSRSKRDNNGKPIYIISATPTFLNVSNGQSYTMPYKLLVETDNNSILYGTVQIDGTPNSYLNGKMYVDSGEKGVAQEVELVNGNVRNVNN
jgi:hypothetical protein